MTPQGSNRLHIPTGIKCQPYHHLSLSAAVQNYLRRFCAFSLCHLLATYCFGSHHALSARNSNGSDSAEMVLGFNVNIYTYANERKRFRNPRKARVEKILNQRALIQCEVFLPHYRLTRESHAHEWYFGSSNIRFQGFCYLSIIWLVVIRQNILISFKAPFKSALKLQDFHGNHRPIYIGSVGETRKGAQQCTASIA